MILCLHFLENIVLILYFRVNLWIVKILTGIWAFMYVFFYWQKHEVSTSTPTDSTEWHRLQRFNFTPEGKSFTSVCLDWCPAPYNRACPYCQTGIKCWMWYSTGLKTKLSSFNRVYNSHQCKLIFSSWAQTGCLYSFGDDCAQKPKLFSLKAKWTWHNPSSIKSQDTLLNFTSNLIFTLSWEPRLSFTEVFFLLYQTIFKV